MTKEQKLDLMKKFKELNIAEYETEYGDYGIYYGLMFVGAEIAIKEFKQYTNFLEGKVDELMLEINELRSTFLHSVKEPFDTPQHSIDVKLLGEIPNPFIQ